MPTPCTKRTAGPSPTRAYERRAPLVSMIGMLRRPSRARERRLALLEERAHAFLAIRRAEQHGEGLELERVRDVDRDVGAGEDDPLALRDGDASLAGDLCRDLLHLRKELGVRDDRVDETDAERV